MNKFTLVTGNKSKLEEWKRILPKVFKLDSKDIDLAEIQSDDPEEIVTHKAKLAYEILECPVVVEDVSAGLNKLNGLPGPFIKFFEKRLGKSALFTLAGEVESEATVNCFIAYYDGTKMIIVNSEVKGKVVAPRGSDGFGFGFCFVPDGTNKTYAELGSKEKDKFNHRALAINQLIARLG